MRRIKDYRTFQDLFPGVKKKWTRITYEQALQLRFELIEIIDKAYRPVFPDGHCRLNKEEDFFRHPDLVFWRAVDIDDDPKTDVVIFGTKREHGNKISGWGHDGSKEGKKFLLDQLAALLTDPSENVYIEVAGAPAQILTSDKYDVPRVPKDAVESIYPDSDFEWMTDGYYIRTLDTGEQTDIEILLGNPTL